MNDFNLLHGYSTTDNGDDKGTTPECLMERFSELVGTLRRRRFTQEDAEDIAAEAVFRGWAAIEAEEVADLKNPRAWLFRVTVNVAMAFNRDMRPSVSIEGTEMEVESFDDPQEKLERQEVIRLIRKSVVKLPKQHRSLIIWRYLKGRSEKEICKYLGVSRGVLAGRMTTARKRLRVLLIRYLAENVENEARIFARCATY